MRVVVLNSNTSDSMTAALGLRAAAVAQAGTTTTAIRPDWGPEAVQGWTDAHFSAAAMLARMAAWHDPIDALVVAGLGDVGLEDLRDLLEVPVVAITEAAVVAAQLVRHRYGVITVSSQAAPLIEASLVAAGHFDRCAVIGALDVSVPDVSGDGGELAARFVDEAHRCVYAGAEVICLVSAALTPFAERLAALVPVPVVDAVAAGVAMAETCVHLSLRTSLAGSWDPADPPGGPD